MNRTRLSVLFLISGVKPPAFCQDLIEVRVDHCFELILK